MSCTLGIKQVVAMLATGLLLSGCAGVGKVPPAAQRLDLGAPQANPPQSSASKVVPLVLSPMSAPAILQSVGVVWRMGSDGTPNRYATYEWSASPASLVHERLIDRLTRDFAVLEQSVNSADATLRINLLQFEQIYTPDGSGNNGVVGVQAVLLRGTTVLAQYRITESVPADANDAPAGARALRTATNQMADNIASWIHQTLQKQK